MLPEPRRRRRNNAQIRVRRNKAPLDLLYANFHTRTARRTTISSFVVFFRFLLPLREATLFCADGPRHSASRRIHTTTTKKKKSTLFSARKIPWWTVRGGMSAPECGRAQTPEDRGAFLDDFHALLAANRFTEAFFLGNSKNRVFPFLWPAPHFCSVCSREMVAMTVQEQKVVTDWGRQCKRKKRSKHGKVLLKCT